MTGQSFHELDKKKTDMWVSKLDTDGAHIKRASKRTTYITVAIVIGILVTAGVVFAGIYLGHELTGAAYKEAKLMYTTGEGGTKYVTVKDNEIDFNSNKQFSVIFDYEKMLVVIDAKSVCYLTRLTPDVMGTFDEIEENVIQANKSGNTIASSPNEVRFSSTNIGADVAMLGKSAADMCEDSPIVWLERQQLTKGNTDHLERRQKRQSCTIEVTVTVKITLVINNGTQC